MDSQRSKIEAMRTEGRDEFDVRQQQQVFNETERVIPDTLRRLQKAVDDLVEFLEVNRDTESLAGSALLIAANEVLAAEGISSGVSSAVTEEAI